MKNQDLLLKLADFLLTLPKNQLHFADWYTFRRPKTTELLGEISCGTVACACGWAGLMPEFRERGFRYDPETGELFYTDPEGTEHGSWHAVRKFFDIDYLVADYLFDTDNPASAEAFKERVLGVIK